MFLIKTFLIKKYEEILYPTTSDFNNYLELFLNSLKFKVILVHGKEHLNDRVDWGLLIHSEVSLNSD